jgi:hypothetical protein
MSEWLMRGHFRYLRSKTFPMTPRTPQCEVFWALLSNSKHSGVPEDSKSPTLEVLGFTPTLGQSGVATGVERRARSPGIILGRDQVIWSRTWIQINTSWLEVIMHAFGVGTSHGLTRTHFTQHGPNSGEANTFPLIVFSAAPHGGYIQMALFPGTPKVESRKCLGLDSRDFGIHNFSPQDRIGTRFEPKL